MSTTNCTLPAVESYQDIDIVDIPEQEPRETIPLETVIALRNKNLTYDQIAKICNCSPQNVQQKLKYHGYYKSDLQNFKDNRADIFAFVQSKLLNSIDLSDYKGLTNYQRVVASGILYDKERLERGQSTENVNVLQINADLEHIQKRKSEILKQLGQDKKDT